MNVIIVISVWCVCGLCFKNMYKIAYYERRLEINGIKDGVRGKSFIGLMRGNDQDKKPFATIEGVYDKHGELLRLYKP